MILDNTNRIYPSGQPESFLRERGLAAIFPPVGTDFVPNFDDGTALDFSGIRYRGLGDITDLSTTDIQNIVTGLNTEQLFQLNLQRGQQGLPPLNPAQYAPGVTVGLNAQTQGFAVIALVGFAAVFLMGRKR